MPILPVEPDMNPSDLWDEVTRSFDPPRRWYCVHSKPRQEKATARDLRVAQIPFYLPLVVQESRTPSGRRIASVVPLFGGYLFLFGDESQRLRALKGNRIAEVIEVSNQDALGLELRQIHRMMHSGLAILPEPSPPVGGLVRITSGPLVGMEGIVIRRGKRDHFVAMVKLLGLGAAVALENWQVEVLEGGTEMSPGPS